MQGTPKLRTHKANSEVKEKFWDEISDVKVKWKYLKNTCCELDMLCWAMRKKGNRVVFETGRVT